MHLIDGGSARLGDASQLLLTSYLHAEQRQTIHENQSTLEL